MSNNPYIQVALTYIRHLFRLGNFLFLIFACPMLFMAAGVRDAFAILPLLMCQSLSVASIRQSCGSAISSTGVLI